MLKKASAAVKSTRYFFDCCFITFQSKIDEKSSAKREKRTCAQNSTKIHSWKVFFQQSNGFCSIFVVPLGPRGSPGTSREPPIMLLGHCQSIPGRAWDAPASPWELLWCAGVSQEGPGTDFGCPRECFGSISAGFWILFRKKFL